MEKLITDLSTGVPKVLTDINTLDRTLKKRAADVLAYFERPGTSDGPTEALKGRLEHLRGSALGFGNLTNYIARSLHMPGATLIVSNHSRQRPSRTASAWGPPLCPAQI